MGLFSLKDHVFFECTYSWQTWEYLTKRILKGSSYTSSNLAVEKVFCIRYAMQCTIHALWREKNKKRHGESHTQVQVFKKIMEKSIRNKFSLNNKNGPKKLSEGTLTHWFGSRE
ncbi:hypothetical protein N665_0169s0007 [Sinapis alba]|nr:hypothetical protein N665_0169s0007 [Sinapis alba]